MKSWVLPTGLSGGYDRRLRPVRPPTWSVPCSGSTKWVRNPWLDGDVEVLVVENQGVWLWGRNGAGAFVERENEVGSAWFPTGEDETGFWVHHAAFEFLSSRFPVHRSVNDAAVEFATAVLHATEPLPCGDWRWPGRRQQMRFRGDSLAMVCDDGEWWWLLLGGPDEAAVAWADELRITWEESDSRKNP
jgi:hypothetical protein